MLRIKVFLISLALLTAAAPAAFSEIMYARTSAEVRSDKTLSAQLVARLNQGDAVNVLLKSTSYCKVSIGAKEGWVYFNKLTAQKPEDVAALLARGPGGGAVKLTEIEAGGALRGLSPMAENYAKAADIPKWAVQAVEDMQSVKISDQELEGFARQGKLGEYGEALR